MNHSHGTPHHITPHHRIPGEHGDIPGICILIKGEIYLVVSFTCHIIFHRSSHTTYSIIYKLEAQILLL